MISHTIGEARAVRPWTSGAELVDVAVNEDEVRQALSYTALTGAIQPGDQVLINTTARSLNLGTGGFDFVVANLTRPAAMNLGPGHIVKGRYLPCQHAVLTLEEQPQYRNIWDQDLGGLPVIACELHSQIAPVVAGLTISGHQRIVYVMTDGAALPYPFSRLADSLRSAGHLTASITCGQAFGGDHETVTLHSALLAARHILNADAVVVAQGPGNAGTGTRTGFSGIEQAECLNATAALGGTPICAARISSADSRERHRGISHHTVTVLNMALAQCIEPVPHGTNTSLLPARHDIRQVEGAEAALTWLAATGINVTTMGRTVEQDQDYFLAAAAAGVAATSDEMSSRL
jgi:hypothetical protein